MKEVLVYLAIAFVTGLGVWVFLQLCGWLAKFWSGEQIPSTYDRYFKSKTFVNSVIDERLLYEAMQKVYYTSERGKSLDRAYIGDTGPDLYAAEAVTIPAGERRTISTGVRLLLPRYYEAQVRPKSGLTKEGLDVKFGTVDNGYRGPVMVTMKNDRKTDFTVCEGMKIAQLVTVRRDDIRTMIVTEEEYQKKAEEVDNPIVTKRRCRPSQ